MTKSPLSDAKMMRIARGFRRGMLGRKTGHGACFVVCLPLEGLLNAAGADVRLEELDFPHTNHFVLRLRDGRILDPTADQFDIKPAVYLGPLPSSYRRWIYR